MAAMPSGMEMSFHTTALAYLAAVTLMVALCRSGKAYHAVPPLFFLMGVFTYSSSTLVPAQEAEGWRLASRALEWLGSKIDSAALDKQTAALMKALLTGDKQWLSADTMASFRKSGASHILALSGLHLGVIYGLMQKALKTIGNSRTAYLFRSLLIILSCSFYSVMTGAGASVTRALLFIILNEISHLSPGRQKSPLSTLLAAMMLQLFFKPQVISTLGFQLSYLAMAGIILIYPKLKEWYPQNWPAGSLRTLWESLALSISCQLTTAPLIWYRFSTFPTFFLLTNLVALPLSELFIIISVILLLMPGTSWLAGITKSLAESLSQTLIFCMETIASLT